MPYISLYRKYRPSTFNDVVGQEISIKILKNAIINDKISHAYIFSGPRGTGKTSVAKIFAKAVNCLNHKNGDLCQNCDVCKANQNNEIDIIEIDAASNNGVDEIRELINNVKLMPVHLKYKVYIIDEVHMLSISAFNALLKTLEEPPSHVIFILATTDINKVPTTVLSRCQKFDFKKLTVKQIKNQLKKILKEEKNEISDEILDIISVLANGGLRDAINLLDQIISLNIENISINDVYKLIGDISEEDNLELFNYIINNDIPNTLKIINRFNDESKNFVNICDRLQLLVRDILIYNNSSNYFEKEYSETLEKYSNINIDKFSLISQYLIDLSVDLKKTDNQKLIFEIYMIKIALISEKNKPQINQKNDENSIKKIENDAMDDKKEDTSVNNFKLKEIKINNCFCDADKKEKEKILCKLDILNEYVSSKEYNSISTLLIKSIPEVVSKTNILFSFKNEFEVVLFEKNIEEIEKLIKKIYDKKYSIVAVTTDEFEKLKKEYIKKIKNGYKYEYISEKINNKNNKSSSKLETTINNLFGDDYTEIN